MIYKQQSNLPIIFQVDEGIINDVNDYLERNKLLFTKVLVVSGKSYSYKFAKVMAERNNWINYILEDNTSEEVEKLKKHVSYNRIDLIVGVGGGSVIDTVKRVSYLLNVNSLSVPTVISNDGLISPISVIKNDEGKTESLPSTAPMGVIIDIDVIKDSPLYFIRSAAGDILSNISATNDWVLAFKNGKESMNDIAFHFSKGAANALLYYENVDLSLKPLLRLVVHGLVNSGIAMSLAGTSRPCSGSEHLISHAIDYLGYSENMLHGTQVGSISLFTLYLQDKLEKKHIKFAQSIDIPLSIDSFVNDFSEEKFIEIMNKAKEMRPGRYTVLDTLSNNDIIKKYDSFKQYLKDNTKIKIKK